MARNFSSLFFKTAKQIGKLQRAALRMAAPKAARKRPVSARKAAVAAGHAAKPAKPARAAYAPAPLGSGLWETSRQFTDSAGRRLAFDRYTPAAAVGSAMPLVVMLHGCRQTSTAFARGSDRKSVV